MMAGIYIFQQGGAITVRFNLANVDQEQMWGGDFSNLNKAMTKYLFLFLCGNDSGPKIYLLSNMKQNWNLVPRLNSIRP